MGRPTRSVPSTAPLLPPPHGPHLRPGARPIAAVPSRPSGLSAGAEHGAPPRWMGTAGGSGTAGQRDRPGGSTAVPGPCAPPAPRRSAGSLPAVTASLWFGPLCSDSRVGFPPLSHPPRLALPLTFSLCSALGEDVAAPNAPTPHPATKPPPGRGAQRRAQHQTALRTPQQRPHGAPPAGSAAQRGN